MLRSETTLVLAGRDRILRNEPSEAWVRRVAGDNTRGIEFAEAAHTLEFAAYEAGYRALLERWGGGVRKGRK